MRTWLNVFYDLWCNLIHQTFLLAAEVDMVLASTLQNYNSENLSVVQCMVIVNAMFYHLQYCDATLSSSLE